jgi:hypothetical protein
MTAVSHFAYFTLRYCLFDNAVDHAGDTPGGTIDVLLNWVGTRDPCRDSPRSGKPKPDPSLSFLVALRFDAF